MKNYYNEKIRRLVTTKTFVFFLLFVLAIGLTLFFSEKDNVIPFLAKTLFIFFPLSLIYRTGLLVKQNLAEYYTHRRVDEFLPIIFDGFAILFYLLLIVLALRNF
jgi:hypothetical protein